MRKILFLFVLSLYTLFGQTVTISETLKDSQGNNLVGFLRIANPAFLYPQGSTLAISNCTNATPIVVTTPTHGLSTNDTVYITGVTGNTACNGTFAITVVTGTTFSLNGSTGNGAYGAGGTVQKIVPVGARTIRYPTTGNFTGAVTVSLIPTTTGIVTPTGSAAGVTYRVTYFINDGTSFTEQWNIPVTPTTNTISAIRAPGVVSPTATIVLSQLAQTGALDTRNDIICWNGSQWTRCFENVIINAQTGTSYTVLDSDRNKIITFSNTSAQAVTLPQANATTFISGWYAWARNINTGRVTITPTTSTIDGAATYVLDKNEDILIISDGTNYSVAKGNPIKPRGEFGCTGTATSSTTLFTAGGGAITACTDTTEGADSKLLASSAGQIRNLRVFAGTGGFSASSGVVTVRINGSNSALTCTIGTGTTCSDTTHIATIAAGDRISVQFTTQGTETLADLNISVEF